MTPFCPGLRRRRRNRLVRSYFFASTVLIAGGLVSAGLLEIYFRYAEGLEQGALAQHSAVTGAAVTIERFIQAIATTMAAVTRSADIGSPHIPREYEFELRRLLFLSPAITEAAALDRDGIVRAEVSRTRAVATSAGRDLSASDAFRTARRGQRYFSGVYFRSADPFVTVSVPIEPMVSEVRGVLQAEVNFREVLDVATAVKFGRAGYGYVVTRAGDLVAHADSGLVLQRRNLGHLPQVKAAFQPRAAGIPPRAIVAYNTEGRKVFSSYALIPLLDWAVFLERPVAEVYGPIYASLLRTSVLLLIGLGVALLASIFVARRVVRPLHTLRRGVERIGSGDLGTRLDVRTGDEIEILADEFNKMTAHLEEARGELEQKVAERTQKLSIANEKLAEVSQHKSQFLASVNHELRTPVAAIIGYGRLLRRETQGQISPLQRQNLQDLLDNAERLLRLIDSLLDFARIEAGKMDVRVQPVAVEEVIQAAVATIEPAVNDGGLRLIRDISPGLPVLYTDREKLRQVILNLLDNAAKFTERGEITVSAWPCEGRLRLVVADTGPGIAPDELGRIFEAFHRGGSPARRTSRGAGLGLAIVTKFVDLLGGVLEVQSEVGKGSMFTVMLPFDRREPEPS